ncbi:hypothetical protein CFAM422_007845 [Trichoderma lentiforme]|uniref:Uncharacterized protein n=1 Tax=Trichoderma lentiforme TaxID=1567552 RepID=A0A9P4XCQ6_9HYPO|nr:hypothetical protein CFAM422_007845 [Trichoderma lentiforme]
MGGKTDPVAYLLWRQTAAKDNRELQTGPPRAAFRINHLVSDNGRLSTTAPSAWKQCPMLVHTLACARDGFNTMEEHRGRLRMGKVDIT